jgi:hypothetical protein
MPVLHGRRFAWLVIAGAALLGACKRDAATNASPEPKSGRPPADACAVLTDAEVSAALGRPAKSDGGGGPRCTWKTASAPVPISVQLNLTDHGPDDERLLKSATDEDIAGLGDEARWSTGLSTLLVVAEKRDFTLQVIAIGSDVDSKAVAVKLAPSVLERAFR